MGFESLRKQILVGMGLAPLAACAPPEAAEVEVPEAELGRATADFTPLGIEVSERAFDAHRLATITVTGAVPGSRVTVSYGHRAGQWCAPGQPDRCADGVAGARGSLPSAEADASGVAVIQGDVPYTTDAADLAWIARAHDPVADVIRWSPAIEGVVYAPAPACAATSAGLADELTPGERLFNFRTHLVCAPPEADGTCRAAADLSDWDGLAIFSDAWGAALPPNWAVYGFCLETTMTDACCYEMTLDDTSYVVLGRPFEVDGRARVAPVDGCAAGWSEEAALPEADGLSPRLRARLVAAWSEAGAAEHASVASFSRFVLELLALGAPADLVSAATRAIADEIDHARASWGLASALAGVPIAPGPLPIGGGLDRSSDPRAVLVAALLEGCVEETLSAAHARVAAERARPALRARLARIADDEARHAELSWGFARWMLAARPELAQVAAAALDGWQLRAPPATDPDRDALAAWGHLTADARHEISKAVVRDVIRPCADALLGRTVARAEAATA